MPRLTIPEKLEPFLFKKKRFKVAIGGRGAAKSQSFADMLLFGMQVHKEKVGCFRELQNSIEDSVHSLFKAEIERLEIPGFETTKTTIDHANGGCARYQGLSRNPDAVKSKHGFTKFWVEEAQSLSQESLDKLTPTLRTDDSEIWFSANPGSAEDPFSKRFIVPFLSELEKNGYYEDDLHYIVWINYYDNPWFPDVLEQERIWDYENRDRAEYDHIWLGKFNDHIEGSIIKAEWFDACVDAHLKLGFKPRGHKKLTHDPADSGDPKAIVLQHGSVILEAMENERDDVNDGFDWAIDLALKNNVDAFEWDAGGLGLSLKRQASESFKGKKIQWQLFNGAESPFDPNEIYEPIDGSHAYQNRKNKDLFRNLRAQCGWRLRDRFYLTYRAVEKNDKEFVAYNADKLISISSNCESLVKFRSETCRIPLKNNSTGLIQLMDKQEMKTKYKINSPNLFDSAMMQENKTQIINTEFLKPLPQRKRAIP